MISGVPEKIAAKAFRLSEAVKAEFVSYGLKKDEQIKVYYKLNQYNQPVIEKIDRLFWRATSFGERDC